MDAAVLERIKKVWGDEDAGKTRLRDALLSAILEIERCHRDLKDTEVFTNALNNYIDRRAEEIVSSRESTYGD